MTKVALVAIIALGGRFWLEKCLGFELSKFLKPLVEGLRYWVKRAVTLLTIPWRLTHN